MAFGDNREPCFNKLRMLWMGVGPVVIGSDECPPFNFLHSLTVDMPYRRLHNSVDAPRDFSVFDKRFDYYGDLVFP